MRYGGHNSWSHRPHALQWQLRDKTGTATHSGNPEGLFDRKDVPMYFALVKEAGGFTAVPFQEWYNFKAIPR